MSSNLAFRGAPAPVPAPGGRKGHRRGRLSLTVVALAAAALAGGCTERSMSDLEGWVQEVLARPGGEIDPLPPIKPYEVYTYQSAGKKDPFEPFFQPEPEQIAQGEAEDSGVKPDFNRNKEELELYPLDSLRMVGTIEREGQIYGIVLTPDQTIHRVKVGNHLGQNFGKIVSIQEDRIELVEIVRDARGRWEERPAALALQEETG